jgi:hypothetical protein
MLLDSERTMTLISKINGFYKNDYILKRCELIALIQRKTTMLKYKLKTFYLALYLLDHIILLDNTSNLELEAVALCSLLLAGISH